MMMKLFCVTAKTLYIDFFFHLLVWLLVFLKRDRSSNMGMSIICYSPPCQCRPWWDFSTLFMWCRPSATRQSSLSGNGDVNAMFLAKISTLASQQGARSRERAQDEQERDTAACVYMLPEAAVYLRPLRACKVTTNDYSKHGVRKRCVVFLLTSLEFFPFLDLQNDSVD